MILGSGSGGNSAVVECGETRLLIDAGLSGKQLALRLAHVGIAPESLVGILLTHEHGDHVRGLATFLKKHPLPVYATAPTAMVVREKITGATWRTFDSGTTFAIGGLRVESFAVHHDAVDPVGFVITHGATRIGFVSDVGHVTRSMITALRDLHALFIEANYDDELLMADTKRPWATKQRISSRHGHLSNAQVEELIREISHSSLRRVVLGHLSSDCNRPDLVLRRLTACAISLGHPVSFHCAAQDTPSEWFDCAHTPQESLFPWP